MQLLGEQINSQVSMLTGSRRCCDADDLAWATLKNQEITKANVVGWNSDGVWGLGRDAAGWSLGTSSTNGDINLLSVMVVVKRTSNDAFSGTVESMSEGVVVTYWS